MAKKKVKTKKKRTISKAGCRAKGHGFEREVAIALRPAYPDAMRHLEYQHGQALGADLANTGDYKIQCKRNRGYASITKIEEVQLCPIDGGIPVLVTKGDGKEAMAVLPFSHLVKLLTHERKLASIQRR